MSVLYLLVLASIAVATIFLIAFIWSIKTNQYEDQKGSALRMLYDNDTDTTNK